MQDDPITLTNDDAIDRRGFLKCMAWAGTGLVFTMHGGVLQLRIFAGTILFP